LPFDSDCTLPIEPTDFHLDKELVAFLYFLWLVPKNLLVYCRDILVLILLQLIQIKIVELAQQLSLLSENLPKHIVFKGFTENYKDLNKK
jgi:hypothetical protein